MKTFNKTLTLTEAKELISYEGPTAYPATEHNKKIMAQAVSDFLLTLRAPKN